MTILRNQDTDEILLIPTDEAYKVAWLQCCEDRSYIMPRDAKYESELNPTEGWYRVDRFGDDDSEILVGKWEELKKDEDWAKMFANAPKIKILEDWSNEEIELVNLKEWLSYNNAMAIDIEHGINTNQIIFDYEDNDGHGWIAEEEVEARLEHEHDQDYPNQEATCLWYCDNGMTIRESVAFFSDDHMNTFEVVEKASYEKEDAIEEYDLEEICGGKALIGFESFEQAMEVREKIGGYLTHFEKKAGQEWKPAGLRSQAFEPYKLEAEDLGYVHIHDKKTVLSCSCFNDEMWQGMEICSNGLDDEEDINEVELAKARLDTMQKVCRIFSEMSDDEVLLLGEDWMTTGKYEVEKADELTTMMYVYDSTTKAIGLML